MMQNKRIIYFFVPLVVFIAIVLLFWIGLDKNPRRIDSPLIDKPLPIFTANDLYSEKIISSSELKNQVSILNVWASWCEPCQIENPTLLSIAKSGIPIYGLNYKDDKPSAIQWLDRFGNPYTKVLYDEQGRVAIDLGTYGIPETFLIDAQGIIRFKWTGALTETVWREEFLPRINQLNLDNRHAT